MSIAATTPAWELALGTTTVRQFGWALGLALGAILVGCGVYLLESRVLAAEERFVQNPADVMMRAFAIGHFLLSLLFLLTSPRIRNRSSLLRIGITTVAGVGVCLLFAYFGAMRNPLLAMLFYGYFLVHEIRDETQIYQAYGDAGDAGPERRNILRLMSWVACLGLMGVLAATYVTHIELTGKRTALDRAPEWLVPCAIGLVGVLTVGVLWRLRQVARRAGSSLSGVLTAHMPLVLVFGGILLVLIVGSPMGSTGLNLIILIHVTAWFVFIHHQMKKRPAAEWRSVWQWLRGTPTGFLVLHLGVIVLVLVLMAVRVHVWQRVGFVSELLATKNFPYWGLLHISMSFWSAK